MLWMREWGICKLRLGYLSHPIQYYSSQILKSNSQQQGFLKWQKNQDNKLNWSINKLSFKFRT